MLSPEKVSGNYKLITVGDSENEDYEVKDICDFGDKGIEYTLSTNHKSYEIRLNVPGAHNAYNATLAIAAGELIGITPSEAAVGLQNAQLTGKRLNICEKNGIKVIDDTYNACEDSIKSAIDTLVATTGDRKVAILGDIVGLVEKSEPNHSAVGRYAASKDIDILIAVGEEAKYYAKGAKEAMDSDRVFYFETKDEFISRSKEILKAGDVVLVKASRAMEMEKIVQSILAG
jgi:UDP-N-acetylmuramoyl-tripeptide--D-alanyl-D-alanine ligase